MRILVADDEILNVKMLSVYLSKWGYQPETYTKSEDAWEALLQPDAPRLAILDWMMPGKSGVEICSEIRKVRPDYPLYIIMLTGKTEKKDLVEGLEAGADDYIKKPFDFEELRSRVQAGVRIVELQTKIEKRARENEQLITSIPLALVAVDPNGRLLYLNKVAETLFGVNFESSAGVEFQDLSISWDWDEVNGLIRSCSEKGSSAAKSDIVFKKGGGAEGVLSVAVNPYSEFEGKSGFLVVVEDITEKRLMEMNLAQKKKLESIGQLAAGIAHEINTPMQYILDNTTFLRESFTDLLDYINDLEEGTTESREDLRESYDIDFLSEEVPQAVTKSLEGIDRVRTIVLAMKDFAHPAPRNFSKADINKAVRDTVTISRNVWKYYCDVEMKLDPSIDAVPCLIDDINQVFLNLIINASDAIGEKLQVESEPDSVGKGKIVVETSMDESWVIISFMDNGAGVPEVIKDRIFDPFFTTKDVGKGTGQGLAISHDIVVNRHRGRIDLSSAPGGGAVFTVKLPREVVSNP